MKPTHIKIAVAFAVLIMISYFILIIAGDNGLKDLNTMKQELKSIDADNADLRQKNVEMYKKIKRLKNDQAYIEHTARQELNMIAEDEVIIKFEEKENHEDE